VAEDVVDNHHFNDSPLLKILRFPVLEELNEWHHFNNPKQRQRIDKDQRLMEFQALKDQTEWH
jgi:hypothetical protein